MSATEACAFTGSLNRTSLVFASRLKPLERDRPSSFNL
jgi:hypothetical protein